MNEPITARSFAPFRRMDGLDCRRALALSSELSAAAGKSLFRQGERSDAVYLILTGSIRLISYRSDESSLELAAYGPGEWLGLAETTLHGPYLTDAVAAEVSTLLRFSAASFERLRRAPGVEAWCLDEMARRVYALSASLEFISPGRRLARYLYVKAGCCGENIELTQEQLAAAVGLARETVNRRLAHLQADGLLRVGRGRIHVLDAAGLGAAAEGGHTLP